MPPSVRELAASRVRDLIPKLRTANVRSSADYVLNFLEQHKTTDKRDLLRYFMLFTNDMDRSRGQNIAVAQPELYEHIIASGFTWTDETRNLNACAN
jgi:hypothetical protein